MRVTTKLTVCFGGLLLAAGAGAGIASAEPDVEAIVNSPCNYSQVVAALKAQDPAAASQLLGNPIANGYLQQLVAAPPDGRRGLIAQLQKYPQLAAYTGTINATAATCSQY
ncbi:hemophore-related protein [Mycolicibacterium arenosum]|uniref:Hemophore-related protein n=1 Tax=Mycolicibacterium arenosum TaxID=2952157 RepID=A0ABT1M4P2_9MYCO|nr:hemophore-related protein [Mycolicibacterium sp. CAU 1645]MCP9274134.1 hemophore-related protein [Mycolicibacterium sp. CAU 1645]